MSAHRPDLADLLRELGIVDAACRDVLLAQRPGPWWLMLLQALAAWFASLLIVSAAVLPAVGLGMAGRGVAGAVLCVAAIVLFRRGSLFTDQMGLALSLAGQGLLVWAAGGHFDSDAYRQMAGAGALVTGAMLLPQASSLHRVVCALFLSLELGVLIGAGPGCEVFGAVLMAVAVLSCVTRMRWAAHPRGGLVGAVMLASGLSALALPAVLAMARGEAWAGALFGRAGFGGHMPWLAGGAALVLFALLGHLLRAASLLPSPQAVFRLRITAGGMALLWVLVFHGAPGLIVAAGVFAAAFHAGQRTLVRFALLAVVLYVGEFYYLLDASLLHKSALLALGGAALLVLRAWMLHAGREGQP
jgi:hypothetical protein